MWDFTSEITLICCPKHSMADFSNTLWKWHNREANARQPHSRVRMWGVSTIIMILAWKADRKKRVFIGLLPFYVFLCCATVYIHAHYAVDAIAGFLAAFPVYQISHKIYYTRAFHRPHGYHS